MALQRKKIKGVSKPILAVTIAAFTLGAVGIVHATLLSSPDKINAPAEISSFTPTNDHQQAFDERQGVTLIQDLICSDAIIPAGETVNSHMIFYNSRFASPEVDANRVWEFEDEIVCVMKERSGLRQAETDTLLGHPDTHYPGPFTGRGLETDGTDIISYTGNTLTLTMTSEAYEGSGDWIRVVTKPSVPEDTTPPTVFCEKGTAPGGKEQKDNGKDPSDGHFFKLVGADETDGPVDLFVTDSESGTEFGPYPGGTNIQILTAKGAQPGESAGSGAVEFKLKVNGPATISATDAAGNTGENICSN